MTTAPAPELSSWTAPDGAAARSATVTGLAAIVLVVSVVSAVLLIPDSPAPVAAVPLWIWLAAFLAAERFQLRVHVGRHGYEVGAAGCVLALGLVLADPEVLVVARLVAAGLVRWLLDRQGSVALALNLGVVLGETTTAISVLELLVDSPIAWTGATALAVVVAVAAGATVGAGVVILTLASSEGVNRPLDLGLIGLVTVVLAAGGAALGALGADLMLTRPDRWWLVLAPAALVVVMLLGYLRQRERATSFAHLFETTRAVHETADAAEAVGRLIREVRVRFGADIVTLTRIPSGGGEPTVRADAVAGAVAPEEFAARAPEPGRAELLAVERPRRRAGRGMAVSVAVPDGSTVVLRAARTVEGAPTFQRVDLDRFRDLATAAVDSLETSRMSEMLTRLREVDEMKTAFLTAVSHDLRTPLTSIQAGAGILVQHIDDMTLEQRTNILTRLRAQAKRLDGMLTDLLDVDRLQRGVLTPIRERTDVAAIARRVVEEAAGTSHPIRLPDEPVEGIVDVGHVARVVENLVKNAIKYTPEGTAVWVDVRREALGVQLVVSDAGPGVDDHQKEAIFEAFVRGDDSHHSPGTGVGLDLVRRLAELHGGRAWVDDRPGGGARFWVSLPDPDDVPEAEHAGSAPTGLETPVGERANGRVRVGVSRSASPTAAG